MILGSLADAKHIFPAIGSRVCTSLGREWWNKIIDIVEEVQPPLCAVRMYNF